MGKTIRFGDLVRQSGRPEVITLWSDPRRDKRLGQAIRENRILTVIQEPASKKKDFGRIGFHQHPYASYFLFPRALSERGEGRVVGINYELAQEAQPEGPLAVPKPGRKPRERGLRTGFRSSRAEAPIVAAPPRPRRRVARKFTVIVKRRAELETAVEVSALDAQTAREQALNKVRRERFDGSKAIVRDEVMSVEETQHVVV